MKHPGFEEEQEWRLVRTQWKKPVPTAERTINLRTNNGTLVPYVPLNWVLPNTPPRDERRGIDEVCCGPSMNADLNEKAVRDLLIMCTCYGSGVRLSNIPLRV